MAQEVGQEVELLGGEREWLAVAADLVGDRVELEVAGAQDGRGSPPGTVPLARRSTAFTRAVSSRGEKGLGR